MLGLFQAALSSFEALPGTSGILGLVSKMRGSLPPIGSGSGASERHSAESHPMQPSKSGSAVYGLPFSASGSAGKHYPHHWRRVLAAHQAAPSAAHPRCHTIACRACTRSACVPGPWSWASGPSTSITMYRFMFSTPPQNPHTHTKLAAAETHVDMKQKVWHVR